MRKLHIWPVSRRPFYQFTSASALMRRHTYKTPGLA